VIKVARDEVYFDYSSTSSTSSTTAGYTTKFITVGLILDVTPQIDGQGNIIMNIHPVLTEKVGEVQLPLQGTQGASAQAFVPILSVREVDTMVKVKEGETVIIGGLLQDSSTHDDVGVRGLSDIPIFGKLFTKTKTAKYKTELVIFLTPKIIYGKDLL
jgi:type II secretory pathway component GspD/PulD (secretin)